MKLPNFPEKPENVAVFRAWLRTLGLLCGRCSKFMLAEIRFSKLKYWDKSLADPAEQTEPLMAASNDPKCSGKDLAQFWIMHEADRELYEALEFCIGDRVETLCMTWERIVRLNFLGCFAVSMISSIRIMH